MSTYALTMYRYNHKLDDKEYKVGNKNGQLIKQQLYK